MFKGGERANYAVVTQCLIISFAINGDSILKCDYIIKLVTDLSYDGELLKAWYCWISYGALLLSMPRGSVVSLLNCDMLLLC